MTRRRRAARGGFTLVEILISVSISAILLGAAIMVVWGVTREDQALRMRTEMQTDATRALKEMTALLRRSGPIDSNGNWSSVGNADAADEFPFVVEDGAATALTGLYAFASNPAMVRNTARAADPTDPLSVKLKTQRADQLDHGAGPSYELVFRTAKDDGALSDGGADDDELPINGSTGEIEWGNAYHALVVVPAKGQTAGASLPLLANELQHWSYDPAATTPLTVRTLAVGVERVLFETVGNKEEDPPPWPLGSFPKSTLDERQLAWPAAPGAYTIRITLCLSRLGPDGNLITIWQQANVTMRCVFRN
jgi:prepilin-type N-terminal cleavage/methylation domain-containing protein